MRCHPQRNGSGAAAQVRHSSARPSFTRRFNGRLGHGLGVGPGDQHARPHLQRQVQKVPFAAQILQREPRTPFFTQCVQLLLFKSRQRRAAGQPCVPPGGKHVKLRGLERRVRDACGLQPVPHRSQGRYHFPSSGFSGRTGSTAAMAHSIMPSSGSLVVMRCSQSPGADTARVSGLSYRPQSLMIS